MNISIWNKLTLKFHLSGSNNFHPFHSILFHSIIFHSIADLNVECTNLGEINGRMDFERFSKTNFREENYYETKKNNEELLNIQPNQIHLNEQNDRKIFSKKNSI